MQPTSARAIANPLLNTCLRIGGEMVALTANWPFEEPLHIMVDKEKLLRLEQGVEQSPLAQSTLHFSDLWLRRCAWSALLVLPSLLSPGSTPRVSPSRALPRAGSASSSSGAPPAQRSAGGRRGAAAAAGASSSPAPCALLSPPSYTSLCSSAWALMRLLRERTAPSPSLVGWLDPAGTRPRSGALGRSRERCAQLRGGPPLGLRSGRPLFWQPLSSLS